MVVQCTTCQSKFRIADDKVTDRGVRVRCTSCKNVFLVKKPGADSNDGPGPGSTMEMSALDAAALSRTAARPGASRPAPAARPAPAPRPAAVASRPPAARNGANGAARRLQADDLFGMSELTGDAPLSNPAASKPPPPPASARPAAKPMPNFDDIDIEVDGAPRPPPPRAEPPSPPPPSDDFSLDAEAAPPPAQDEAAEGSEESGPVKIGAFKSGPLKDPFEGMNLGEPASGAIELAAQPRKEKLAEGDQAQAAPAPAPEIAPGRDMVSSALTGLVGAALAVAVVIVAALSDDASAGWLGFGRGDEVVATRVVSGLYDTVSGKPVFFVRGRIENRGQKIRGPVRVTAELISDGAGEVKAEAMAGAEPTAEEVWSLRSQADVDKLNRDLGVTPIERKLQPGASLPFFAVIPDPPPDLHRHRLHLKVEPVDAWVPPSTKAGKGR